MEVQLISYASLKHFNVHCCLQLSWKFVFLRFFPPSNAVKNLEERPGHTTLKDLLEVSLNAFKIEEAVKYRYVPFFFFFFQNNAWAIFVADCRLCASFSYNVSPSLSNLLFTFF